MKNNNYHTSDQDKRILKLENDRDKVFEHIATTNEEMGKIKVDLVWLKKNYWIVATASVGAVISGIITLIVYLISR